MKTRAVIIGAFLGLLLTLDGGIIFFFFLMGLALFILKRYFKEKNEQIFIISFFLLGFLVRLLLCEAVFIYNTITDNLCYYSNYTGNCLFGDGAFLSVMSKGISDIWKAKVDPAIFLPFFEGGGSHHYYLYGLFHYLFGNDIFSVKLLGILFGTITSVFIYLIAKELFNDKRIARASYLLMLFFPSFVLWSITNLKDHVQTLLFSIWIYFVIIIRKRPFRTVYFIPLLCVLFFTLKIRSEMGLLLVMGTAFGYFLSLGNSYKKIILILLLTALVVMLGYFYVKNIDAVFVMKIKLANFIKSIVNRQVVIYHGHGFNYKIYPGKFYIRDVYCHIIAYMFKPLQLIGIILKAVFFFLVVPLPWMVKSVSQALVFPQVLLWYMILVLFFVGLIRAICTGNRYSYIIPCILFAMVFPAAMVSSNIGTVFRHRDMFTPFFFAYAFYGLFWVLNVIFRIDKKNNYSF